MKKGKPSDEEVKKLETCARCGRGLYKAIVRIGKDGMYHENCWPYIHPRLGEITEDEVYLIEWDREVRVLFESKHKKIDEIIKEISNEAKYNEYGGWLNEIVKKLEKFKEEEL